MTIFNASELTPTPDAIAQALTLNGAPAALVSIFDGVQASHAVSGASDLETGVPAALG